MDGIVYMLDQAGRGLAQAEQTINQLQQTVAERDARIAELEAIIPQGKVGNSGDGADRAGER